MMSNRGVPLRVIQKISGHSSLEVLQRYLEVSDEQIGAAVGLLLNFPRINILAMAKSLTEPELKQYNTNGLLDTKS